MLRAQVMVILVLTEVVKGLLLWMGNPAAATQAATAAPLGMGIPEVTTRAAQPPLGMGNPEATANHPDLESDHVRTLFLDRICTRF